MSKITCDLPSAALAPSHKVSVSLVHFYIAFHGKTWYEDKFSAVIADEEQREQYYTLLRNFDDPGHKPAYFNFCNDDLNEILYPLFETSSTWREIFSAISAAYADSKCAMVYPWLYNAMLHIMDGRRPYENRWMFDIRGPSIKTVKYKSFINTGKYGGSQQRLTRRKIRELNLADPAIRDTLKYKGLIVSRHPAS
jgi:hypothetical protein